MGKIILVLNLLITADSRLYFLNRLIVDPVSPLMPGVWAGGRAGCAWPVCVWANVSLVQPPPSVSRVNTSGDLRPVLEPHLPASRADNIQPAHLNNKRKISENIYIRDYETCPRMSSLRPLSMCCHITGLWCDKECGRVSVLMETLHYH